jgi:hypothetical protein
MKIEITNEGEHFYIYKNGDNLPMRNLRRNLNIYAFFEDEIEALIGEKEYNGSFQKGKYQYNVSDDHLKLISGERSAKNRTELELTKHFIN